MNDKFEFTGETRDFGGATVRRIRALRDIQPPRAGLEPVRAGELGGWLQHPWNLSVHGGSWVGGEAVVLADADVFCDAWVTEHAIMTESAYAMGWALVTGHALLAGHVIVSDRARIGGHVIVSGRATIGGHCVLLARARLLGHVVVDDNNHKCICFDQLGSRGDTLTIARDRRIGMRYTTGCFSGTREQFVAAVAATHGDNEHAKAYRAAVNEADAWFWQQRGYLRLWDGGAP